MPRRVLAWGALALWLWAATAATAATASERPNVLFVFTDDGIVVYLG